MALPATPCGMKQLISMSTAAAATTQIRISCPMDSEFSSRNAAAADVVCLLFADARPRGEAGSFLDWEALDREEVEDFPEAAVFPDAALEAPVFLAAAFFFVPELVWDVLFFLVPDAIGFLF